MGYLVLECLKEFVGSRAACWETLWAVKDTHRFDDLGLHLSLAGVGPLFSERLGWQAEEGLARESLNLAHLHTPTDKPSDTILAVSLRRRS